MRGNGESADWGTIDDGEHYASDSACNLFWRCQRLPNIEEDDEYSMIHSLKDTRMFPAIDALSNDSTLVDEDRLEGLDSFEAEAMKERHCFRRRIPKRIRLVKNSTDATVGASNLSTTPYQVSKNDFESDGDDKMKKEEEEAVSVAMTASTEVQKDRDTGNHDNSAEQMSASVATQRRGNLTRDRSTKSPRNSERVAAFKILGSRISSLRSSCSLSSDKDEKKQSYHSAVDVESGSTKSNDSEKSRKPLKGKGKVLKQGIHKLACFSNQVKRSNYDEFHPALFDDRNVRGTGASPRKLIARSPAPSDEMRQDSSGSLCSESQREQTRRDGPPTGSILLSKIARRRIAASVRSRDGQAALAAPIFNPDIAVNRRVASNTSLASSKLPIALTAPQDLLFSKSKGSRSRSQRGNQSSPEIVLYESELPLDRFQSSYDELRFLAPATCLGSSWTTRPTANAVLQKLDDERVNVLAVRNGWKSNKSVSSTRSAICTTGSIGGDETVVRSNRRSDSAMSELRDRTTFF